MNYMTAKEAARLWNISQRRVAVLCAEQKIQNAERLGNMWLIPKDSKKPIDGRGLRFNNSNIKPFVKWAGGKAQLIEEIRKLYPTELGENINKYAEPFVGGGAVLFDILSRYELKEVYISDTNAELITTYKVIRDDVEEIIALLSKYQLDYSPMCESDRKIYYYTKRARFNDLKLKKQMDTELASLFIFLNRTCFNGLYRVNSKGEYNVPMGSYKSPIICDEAKLRQVARALSKVSIFCADYRESASFIDKRTFAYFDPPYRPLNITSSFTAYTEHVFDDAAQVELARFIKIMVDKGAYILTSNSDPRNVDPNDNFFDELYSKMKILRVPASRMINSNPKSRGKILELLICSEGAI